MERRITSWNNALWKSAGVYTQPTININSAQDGVMGIFNQPIVKQHETEIRWTLNNTTGVRNCIFRVTIILSKAYFCWLPQEDPLYNFGLTAPPVQYLFDDYKPSSQIRTEVLPFVEVLADEVYCLDINKPIIHDRLCIDSFTYNWCVPNDFGPRFNGLWMLITAVEYKSHNVFQVWSTNQNTAPCYDVSVSCLLEPSIK